MKYDHIVRYPLMLGIALLSLVGCGPEEPPVPIPQPEVAEMESQVRQKIDDARAAIEAEPRSADAWGKLGMIFHIHDLFDEGTVAYEQAVALAPDEVRWPYYLGALKATVGTDLEGAEANLRRAVEMRSDYGPAYMRLGNVLVAKGDTDGAAETFAKALELEPELHPARVGLGQARLAQDRLDEAVELLEAVLEVQPRNSRALASLGQAYSRLGRRDEARAMADRTRDAADYNLYDDPMMAKVIAEGASSTLIWERAKAFLENADYPQALAGLKQVVRLQPENPGVQHQLAFVYRELGQNDRALPHLAKAVRLEPERADARVQLGVMLLDAERPGEALSHLRAVYNGEATETEEGSEAVDRIEVGWLLGRALLRTGAAPEALGVFETTAQRSTAAGVPIPVSAHNEWGNVLAQSGRIEEAAGHFEAALKLEPRNPESLYYMGLIMEAYGRRDDAVRLYRRALESGPNDLVMGRLNALQANSR